MRAREHGSRGLTMRKQREPLIDASIAVRRTERAATRSRA